MSRKSSHGTHPADATAASTPLSAQIGTILLNPLRFVIHGKELTTLQQVVDLIKAFTSSKETPSQWPHPSLPLTVHHRVILRSLQDVGRLATITELVVRAKLTRNTCSKLVGHLVEHEYAHRKGLRGPVEITALGRERLAKTKGFRRRE